MAMQTSDAALLPLVRRTWRGFKRAMKVGFKTIGWRLTGRSPLGMGRSLVAQLMHILQDNRDVPVWLQTELVDSIVDKDRVVGAVVDRDGTSQRIRAEHGVLLGAGGFAQNDSFRREHQPVGDDWTSVAPGDEGDAIQIASDIGAELAMMDKSWWGASFKLEGDVQFSVWERSMPDCILVDQDGVRFANESTSYVDLGRKILEHDEKHGNAVPSWLILDNNHRKRYLFGDMPPGYTPSKHVESGDIIKATSLDDLADQCEMDADQLAATVDRFNGFAHNGIDEDFRRGDGIYDRYYSDPRVQPNPNLAPIENAPFWAIRMYPGDLGTKGGLVTETAGSE
jgi:3-oxosteroid 1-dehydrogenase